MFEFTSDYGLIIQGLLAVILIGVFYNLWSSTKIYGGIIGQAIRLFGFGMLFITISLLERVLINFGIILSSPGLALIQDLLSLIGLIFLSLGFSRLIKATRV